ncbi:neutral/alkaline non-lysosomal ceramidase N-terminal domain-containing protein [Alcanivorax sp.]|uniref:neutral/alkaline non-lysosomal ceramidase N-terminal domain-containing protein n=1 Tax=Alcanivorax sp. TaxID=1872427 RepID=UPI0032D99EFE
MSVTRSSCICRWLASIGVLIVIVGLAHTAWPFLFFPRQQLDITLTPPLSASQNPHPVAGIAERDITPPIGMPKFGYSAWAKAADGFRTRLKARAFYLHAPGQTPMAIVQLDLGTGSLPLHHRVAERIAQKTDVPAHALSLLVTHTHSGPGQYLGSDFYNVFGSNKPGFDPALFAFLSKQIADAVIEAYSSRQEARFAVGQSDIRGYTRNRSLAAWANNFPGRQLQDDDSIMAVNPTMTLLRIDQRQGDTFVPAGALSLYSIHGTAIPPFTRPYHADVWHWISGVLEDELTTTAPGFIHGAAQATHADNNPAWHEGQRGDLEAQRIGVALGEHAVQLFHSLAGQLTRELDTAVASRQLNVLEQIDTQRFGLCERAIVGASVAGAANGDEVFPISYLPFLKEDWPRRFFTDNCQGVKQWMLSKLQLLLPKERFPHQALFQIIRVNELVLVPLPWEVTLESGNRLRSAIADTLPVGTPWKVEVSSLANGYFGYAATPEEYQRQYYEGGHTLYGPHTLDFLIGQSVHLSQDMQQSGDILDIPRKQTFSLLSHQYFPERKQAATPPAGLQWQGQPELQQGEPASGPYWRITLLATPAERLALTSLHLGIHCQGQPVATDDGAALQLQWQRQGTAQDEYEIRWYADTEETHTGCKFAIAATRSGPTTLSPAIP